MATVVALTSFTGWLTRDELGPAPKNSKGQKIEGEELGFAPGLPVHDQYGNQLQEVKEGKKIAVKEGQLFESSHPAVKKWPELFGQPAQTRGVEQATAAPGEKRA